MYNPNFNYNYPYRNPINIPSQRTHINPLNGRKSFSMSQMISSAEKSVDTISSIIPLYKKVKPIIDQGKSMLSSVTNYFNKKTTTNTKVEHVEVEIVDDETKDNKSENKMYEEQTYRTNNTQSKPFFL